MILQLSKYDCIISLEEEKAKKKKHCKRKKRVEQGEKVEEKSEGNLAVCPDAE